MRTWAVLHIASAASIAPTSPRVSTSPRASLNLRARSPISTSLLRPRHLPGRARHAIRDAVGGQRARVRPSRFATLAAGSRRGRLGDLEIEDCGCGLRRGPIEDTLPRGEVGPAAERFSLFLGGASGDSTTKRLPPQLLLFSRGGAPRLRRSARTNSMAVRTGWVPRWR